MKAEKFSGKISQLVDGATYDATSFVIIGDSMVEFASGRRRGQTFDEEKQGSLINFNQNKQNWEKKAAGKKAEVYAILIPNQKEILKSNQSAAKQYFNEGEELPKEYEYLTKVKKIYTIYGDKGLYIKLLE